MRQLDVGAEYRIPSVSTEELVLPRSSTLGCPAVTAVVTAPYVLLPMPKNSEEGFFLQRTEISYESILVLSRSLDILFVKRMLLHTASMKLKLGTNRDNDRFRSCLSKPLSVNTA